jgi:carboxyl-terminal processing protease
MRLRFLAILTGALVSSATIHAADSMSPEAKTYLEAAIQIMQESFLHKDRIDWERLRAETLAQAEGAQTSVDTYAAIRFALTRLGDQHSFLQLTPALTREEAARKTPRASTAPIATQAASRPPSRFQNRRAPEGSMIETGPRPLARIVVPLFSGPDLDAFATKLQNLVGDLASKEPCGWMVDLRGNGGGNMWPMLAGIGPILGEGEPGAFLNDKRVKTKWFYENGRAGERPGNPEYYAKTMGTPVVLPASPPVTVLIDGGTASSGEAIAVAFRGRPDTRFFGEMTYGLANATAPFKLSDGAALYLVVAVDLDRNGTEYDFGVKPDEEIQPAPNGSTDDPVLRAAADWLSAQKACTLPGK